MRLGLEFWAIQQVQHLMRSSRARAPAQKRTTFLCCQSRCIPLKKSMTHFYSSGKKRWELWWWRLRAVFFNHRTEIAQIAIRNRLPSIFSQREYAVSGGLMSYGENLSDFFHRAAFFVDKIFKGANPGDIPVEQPTRFHLTINRKTADALGLTIPSQLYIFADDVIE